MNRSGWTPASPWPTSEELLLLRAALCDGSSAPDAWLEFWATAHGIDHLEGDALRVLPQLFRNLEACAFEDPALGRLRGIYRHAWYSNQLLLQSVSHALTLLRGAAVDTMILDGAALVARGIRDVGARLMDSIEILVRPGDAVRAVEILGTHGWVTSRQGTSDQVVGGRPVAELVNGRHGKLRLLGSLRCLGDHDKEVWGAADTVSLGGATTQAPCLVDQLLLDCAQGLDWAPASRRWIPDVTLLVKANTERIEWVCLAERSRHFGVALDVADALEFLGVEFQLEFPRELPVGLRQKAGPSARVFHRLKMRPRRRSVLSRAVRRTVRGSDALRRQGAARNAPR